MKRFFPVLLVVALVALASATALAAGFAINEQGARAMGQAMAFAARADDPSAVFFNPAGITQLEGLHFYTGGTLIAQQSTWNSSDSSQSIDSDDRFEVPPHLYLTYQVNKKWFFGMGLFVPYGLSKAWPDNFPGKYINKSTRLMNFCFNPNIAYKVTDAVSVAAGVDVIYSVAKLDRALYLQPLSNAYFGGYPLADGYFSADVKDTAVGWNVAMHAKLTERVSLGISYRAQVKLNLDGDLTLTVPHTGVAQIDGTLAALFPNQPVKTEITLPDTLFVGIGGKVTDKFDTEVDLQFTNWTDYDELPFMFSKQTAAIKDTTVPKDWGNGWVIRWGNEYHYSESSDLRAGFYYDMNPVPDATLDPTLPDSDRLSFQAGYGWHNEHITFDIAYMYLYFLKRDIHTTPAYGVIPSTGSYESHANLFSLSLGYKF